MGTNVSTYVFKECDEAIEINGFYTCCEWEDCYQSNEQSYEYRETTTITTADNFPTTTTATISTATNAPAPAEAIIENNPEMIISDDYNYRGIEEILPIDTIREDEKFKNCLSNGDPSDFCIRGSTGSFQTSSLDCFQKNECNDEAKNAVRINFSLGDNFDGGIFAVSYQAVPNMKKSTLFEVSSQVVSVNFPEHLKKDIKKGDIEMVFPQLEGIGGDHGGKTKCVFWNEEEKTWDPEGVSMVSEKSNSSHVTCTTEHLTNFATIHVRYFYKFPLFEENLVYVPWCWSSGHKRA